MKKNVILLFSVMLLLSAATAVAQDHKFEFKPFFGFTISSGVDTQPQAIPGNAEVDKISPKSSFSWGLQFDYLATQNFSLGFLFDQQLSKLRGHTTLNPGVGPNLPGAPGDVDFADLDVYNYHGVFTYNAGSEDAPIRPFFFGGLGATQYSPGDLYSLVQPFDGSGKINGATKFSTTWGGGVKAFAGPHVGFQFMMRWTPTYIKTDASGVWCNPWWGCWVTGNDHYSHQLGFSGGLVLRF